MTTIAYRDGVLAGDTRITDDDGVITTGHLRKVCRLRNGTLLGFAGTIAKIHALIKQAQKNPDGVLTIKPDKDELEALLIYQDGKVMQLDPGGWAEVKAKFYAIGSGDLPARVAMSCGLSAVEAVKKAMEFDSKTGGRVQSVKLK